MLKKVSAFHRRQLRVLAGIRWPHRISNQGLCAKLQVEPLEAFVRRARVKLFGHVLRMEAEAPAQRAMDFYMTKGRRRKGRRRCCLPEILKDDMEGVGLQFAGPEDLDRLRGLAADRRMWQDLVHLIEPLLLKDGASDR